MKVDSLLLFLILQGMLSIFTIENNISYRLIIYGFYYVEVGSFFAQFLKSFNHKCVLNFVKGFSCIYEVIIWFLSLNFLVWCITLIDLHILKNTCIPVINPTWSWCMSFLMYYWIILAKILWWNFASIFISDIGRLFSFFVLFLSVFHSRVMVAL